MFINLNSVFFENMHVHAFVVENRREEKKAKNALLTTSEDYEAAFVFGLCAPLQTSFKMMVGGEEGRNIVLFRILLSGGFS